MKIDRITYQKTFAAGPYLNEKIGVEISLDEGEEKELAFRLAQITVEEFHKQANPHLYPPESMRGVQEGNGIPYVPLANAGQSLGRFNMPSVSPPIEINLQEERQKDGIGHLLAIQCSPSLDDLKTYKTLANSDPTKKLYDAYCQRLKELTK
jgi:hypothetical protein